MKAKEVDPIKPTLNFSGRKISDIERLIALKEKAIDLNNELKCLNARIHTMSLDILTRYKERQKKEKKNAKRTLQNS